jgi:hypothetical protein
MQGSPVEIQIRAHLIDCNMTAPSLMLLPSKQYSSATYFSLRFDSHKKNPAHCKNILTLIFNFLM